MKAVRRLMVVAVALGLVAPAVAHAQLAGVAREVVEEAAEQVARRAGSTAARELAEVGGKAGVREVLEKAAAEGGEGLVRKAAQYGVAHGPVAMRAIGRSPAKMVQALDDLAPGLRPAALRAVEREPQVLTGLVNRYGAEALETATKHPGVGTVIGEKLGAEGLGAARTLTTDQAIVVARHADEIAKLPPAQRAGVMAKLRENAGGVVTFLERHPKTLLTAGGVAVLLGAKDEILGPGGGPGGKPPGLVQRVWQDTVGVVRKPVGMAGAVLVGLVAAWAAGRVWVSWKKRRIEGRVAEARGQAQVERARSGVA